MADLPGLSCGGKLAPWRRSDWTSCQGTELWALGGRSRADGAWGCKATSGHPHPASREAHSGPTVNTGLGSKAKVGRGSPFPGPTCPQDWWAASLASAPTLPSQPLPSQHRASSALKDTGPVYVCHESVYL